MYYIKLYSWFRDTYNPPNSQLCSRHSSYSDITRWMRRRSLYSLELFSWWWWFRFSDYVSRHHPEHVDSERCKTSHCHCITFRLTDLQECEPARISCTLCLWNNGHCLLYFHIHFSNRTKSSVWVSNTDFYSPLDDRAVAIKARSELKYHRKWFYVSDGQLGRRRWKDWLHTRLYCSFSGRPCPDLCLSSYRKFIVGSCLKRKQK